MNDDPAKRRPRGWIGRLGHLLAGEPQDRAELIDTLREAQRRNLFDPEALSMIEGVLQVSELRVRDIMIPRPQTVVVPQDAKLEIIFPLVIKTAHSRYPVIGEDRTEVVGILLVKDLFAHALSNPNLAVREIMRPAQFVPESKRLNVLLREFRATRNHMAIVVDEYGTAAGLVTIEDVLEQIVGDIDDEYDDFEDEAYVFRRGTHDFTVKALMPVEEFNEYFGAQLDDTEFDTLGGLIVQCAGSIPKRGEQVELGGFRFEVLRADNRRIHLLRLHLAEGLTDRDPEP